MQITIHEEMRSKCLLPESNRKNPRLLQRIGCFCAIAILFLTPSLSKAQGIDVHKLDIHLKVGSAIDNDQTRKALETVGKIKGMEYTMHRYNERFGNDSVHATKFVDREPDPKADDPLTKNYFNVVVGSDSVTMVHLWFTFLVRKDMEEVLYYDPKQGKTLPMDEWKKVWPASEFLRDHED